MCPTFIVLTTHKKIESEVAIRPLLFSDEVELSLFISHTNTSFISRESSMLVPLSPYYKLNVLYEANLWSWATGNESHNRKG
jgi:hypothetical protein